MAKTAATATTAPVDLEIGGSRDQIAASGSSSFTPDDTPSKAATPRRSLDFEDGQPVQRSFVTKTWRKAEQRLPAPVTRWSRKAVAWIKGPELHVSHRINPLFEPVQTYPAHLIARLPKPVRFCLFAAAFILWVVLFGVIISDFSLPTNLAGYGAPVKLGCTAQLWSVIDEIEVSVTVLTTPGPMHKVAAWTDGIAFLSTTLHLRSTAQQTAQAPKS